VRATEGERKTLLHGSGCEVVVVLVVVADVTILTV
jgi:hypothetical protein